MRKPVFIIGCPRSGTTLTLHIMAIHEEFAWVSDLLNNRPKDPKICFLNKIYDLPVIGRPLYLYKTQSKTNLVANKAYNIPYLGNHINPANSFGIKELYRRVKSVIPKPVEPWEFWNTHLSKFQWKRNGKIPPRRRTEKDISSEEIKNSRNIIESVCRYQRKNSFLSKYTEFPRIAYLTQAFPEARFIHVKRDAKAAVSSYLVKMENGDFKTWDEREWWIKGWPKEWREKWLREYKTPLSFVAYLLKFYMHEIEKESLNYKNQCIEVNYNDIINSPHRTFNRIFEFCGLKMSQRVDWYLRNIILLNMNEKWKKKFTAKEKKILENVVSECDSTHQVINLV